MARRVFFSFHYDDVSDFRANVVRQHWLTKDDREDAGFFDASIWESARRTGAEGIKRLINSALEDTTVTAVLIGSATCSRRWVRYEIVKSMQRGNGLFGVHINGIRDKFQQIRALGNNPFDYLGVGYNDNGTSLNLIEWADGRWESYGDANGYSLATQRPHDQWGKAYQLSHFYEVYDWIAGDGYNNFSKWVEKAAPQAQ